MIHKLLQEASVEMHWLLVFILIADANAATA